MGFSIDVSIPVFTVFVQGLLSFFSPCVLPLIPLYIGYLSGGTQSVSEDGRISFNRKKVLVNTIFFVIGISFTFFLLGIGVSVLGSFLKGNQIIFARIGGVLVIAFGLYQLGVFGKSTMLGSEHRLQLKMDRLAMSPWMALIMGFTFSFAWTPCVGPALSSVLLMAASASTKMTGFVMIAVYTLGFILPFLAVGIFGAALLELFKKHNKVVRYTVKIGGVLMILMGVMMFTGKMNAITGYLSQSTTSNPKSEQSVSDEKTETQGSEESTQKESTQKESTQKESEPDTSEPKETKRELPDAIDFELKDQYGNVHKLSDYKGKVVFLNFWATWCPPCRAEMPDMQKLHEEYNSQENPEVVILGIAGPNYGREKTEDEVKTFLEENGYTYPVVMNEGGSMFDAYGISSYPTTFMITEEGKVFGYVSGQLSEEIMRSIIKQTLENKNEK